NFPKSHTADASNNDSEVLFSVLFALTQVQTTSDTDSDDLSTMTRKDKRVLKAAKKAKNRLDRTSKNDKDSGSNDGSNDDVSRQDVKATSKTAGGSKDASDPSSSDDDLEKPRNSNKQSALNFLSMAKKKAKEGGVLVGLEMING